MVVVLAAAAAGTVALRATGAAAQGPVLLPCDNVAICHATGADDPYMRQSASVDSIVS